MSAGAYLLGCALVVATAVSLAYGVWSLRGWLMPQWSGGPARLAESVLAIATVVLCSELLGSVHAFDRFPLVLVVVGVGVGMGFLGRRGRRAATVHVRFGSALAATNRSPRIEVGAVTIAGAAVAAQWAGKVAYAFDTGMTHFDTISFHAPYAAEFFQRGYLLVQLDRTQPFHAFGGQTSELLHAVLALAMNREVFSPLVNVGWAALAVLAAWCLGRRHGVGALCALGSVAVLGLPMITASHPGQAANDVAAAALLLAAAVILLEGGLALAPTAIAGFAAGLAVSTKLTAAMPVAVLTIGILVLARKRERGRAAASWVGACVISGSYWFVRNAVVAHNPLPSFNWHLGPVTLSGVTQRHPASIERYLFHADAWDKIFLPGLHTALGVLWPLVVVMALVGAATALSRGRPPLERLTGLAMLAGLVTYVFTPDSAAGFTFKYEVRLATPALLGCMCLLPLALVGRGARWRRVTAGLFLVLIVFAITRGGGAEGVPAWSSIAAVVGPLAGIAVIGGVVAWFVFPREHWSLQLSVRIDQAAITAIAVLAVFYPIQLHYLDNRYVDSGLTLDRVNAALHNVHHAHIAYFGTPETYPFFGTDLSNTVDQPTAPAPQSPGASCRAWLFTLNNYDYVVIAHQPFPIVAPPEDALSNDRHVTRVVNTLNGSLYKLNEPLAANGC